MGAGDSPGAVLGRVRDLRVFECQARKLRVAVGCLILFDVTGVGDAHHEPM